MTSASVASFVSPPAPVNTSCVNDSESGLVCRRHFGALDISVPLGSDASDVVAGYVVSVEWPVAVDSADSTPSVVAFSVFSASPYFSCLLAFYGLSLPLLGCSSCVVHKVIVAGS